jgi:hypothetical protein
VASACSRTCFRPGAHACCMLLCRRGPRYGRQQWMFAAGRQGSGCRPTSSPSLSCAQPPAVTQHPLQPLPSHQSLEIPCARRYGAYYKEQEKMEHRY